MVEAAPTVECELQGAIEKRATTVIGALTETAGLQPQLLRQRECIGAIGRIVDRVGDVDTGRDGNTVKIPAELFESAGDIATGVGLVP